VGCRRLLSVFLIWCVSKVNKFWSWCLVCCDMCRRLTASLYYHIVWWRNHWSNFDFLKFSHEIPPKLWTRMFIIMFRKGHRSPPPPNAIVPLEYIVYYFQWGHCLTLFCTITTTGIIIICLTFISYQKLNWVTKSTLVYRKNTRGYLRTECWEEVVLFTQLHNFDLNNLYSAPDIVVMIKWGWMRCAGHVSYWGNNKYT
jgi:hypothetical protein